MKFTDLMNDLINLKNEAQDLTQTFSENDDKAAGLTDSSYCLLEGTLDSCKNPNREVQKPITKIFTEVLEPVEGDTLYNKVVEFFNGYKNTFEELSKGVSELITQCRTSYSSLKKPVEDLMKETNGCYLKYKTAIDNLVKPLQCIIQGFEINEFKQKNFKDPEVLKTFHSLLEELKTNFKKYNVTARKFNEESYNIFVKVEANNTNFSKYMEEKMVEQIRQIPNLLSKGICLLPSVCKDIKTAPPKDEKGRAEYFDKSLNQLLEVTREAEKQREKAYLTVETEMQNLKGKLSEVINEIQNNKDKYTKYIESLKTCGNRIAQIVDEIRKLFDKDKLAINKDLSKVEYPFYEFAKKLNVVYDKLEDTKEQIKPKLKIVMVALGNQLNKITIDLAFIMDITISMDDLVDEIRKSIKYIIDKIKQDSPGIDIRFAYEGYRDFADLEAGDKYVSIDFTSDVDWYKEQLDKIVARGGGDDAEDVAGGLDAALKMNWKSNARYAVFIADAPGHGTKYHTSDVEDHYPNGDPNGLSLEELMMKYARSNINFNAVRIAEFTDITYDIMGKVYKQESKRIDLDCFFEVLDYDNIDEKSGKKVSLRKSIAKNAIDIYNKYCKKEIEALNVKGSG